MLASVMMSVAVGSAVESGALGGLGSDAGDSAASSLLDALAFKTRQLIAAADIAVAANTSLIEYLTPSASSLEPIASFLPIPSALLACLVALVLYVWSWTVLASRDTTESEDERSNASFNGTPAEKQDAVQPPTVLRAIYAFCGIFVQLYRCCVFVCHLFLNRAVPFRDCSVYLRGFSCAALPDDWTVSTERFRHMAHNSYDLPDKAAAFCLKLLGRSGLGEQTYFPPGILSYPPDRSMRAARAEADFIFGNTLDQLFASTGIKPKEVDILVVNCSLFAPTPSLAAMIINKYKMREDINSYNLSGMGCSAGLISIHLAKDLLRTHPNSIALVVSTELITQQIYTGTETNMLLQNSLFRAGGAAVILTNKSSDFAFGRARYELEHTVRTTLAADTDAYTCVFQDEDACGNRGVRLEKSLMSVAGKAMLKNIARLGPKILPYSEQIKYGLNMVARVVDTKFRVMDKLESLGLVAPPTPPTEEQIRKQAEKAEKDKAAGVLPPKPRYRSRIPEYTPDFRRAVDHICIHAGGRAVIDAIQGGLNLTDDDVAASRATLKRYGNTSSSSIWYEFKFCEQNRGIKQGERVWQLGFGSGFKCNSAIWRKL